MTKVDYDYRCPRCDMSFVAEAKPFAGSYLVCPERGCGLGHSRGGNNPKYPIVMKTTPDRAKRAGLIKVGETV